MKKMILWVPAALTVISFMGSPLLAAAHERQVFQIGNKQYQFVVGSVNEPAYVDDKSGVELAITQIGVPGASGATEHADGDDHGDENSAPVIGLEKTLKAEVLAGNKKKTFDLRAVFGEEGSYSAVFFPTVATTYTYRIFGTVNNVPVDLSFICNPAGTPAAAEDKNRVTLSPDVERLNKVGAFGCPLAKEDAGFPEAGVSGYALKAAIANDTANLMSQMDTLLLWATIGVILGLIGAAFGIGLWLKNNKK